MKNRTVTMLQPDFYANFKCDGTICEDNCCIGKWQIHVDKKHYKKLKNVKNLEFKKIIDKHIKRNRNSDEDFCYGKILQKNEDNACPFINKEKLCDIQLNLGYDYLCNVCKVYPRHVRCVNGEFERALTVSCPIAAKIILTRESGFGFENVEENIENIIQISSDFNFNKVEYIQKAEKYFWDIRIFCIQIMKSRDYEIYERIAILGLFMNELIKLEKENKVDDIPNIINDFTIKITSAQFKDWFVGMQGNVNFKIKFTKEIMDEAYNIAVTSERYKECFKDMISGLSMESSLEESSDLYINSYKLNYKPYLEKKEYILENYFVNSIFIDGFPFSNKMNMWDNYLLLAVNYSIINMLLIGMMEHYKNSFTDEHVIKAIQSFAKVFDHNSKLKQYILDLIKKNSYDTMAYSVLLLKD